MNWRRRQAHPTRRQIGGIFHSRFGRGETACPLEKKYVISNASERLCRAVRPVVETLEERRLLSGDPLAYQNVVQPLPYALDFTQQINGVFDSAGQSIGFTRVQANTAGNQYQPALINLNTSAGELDLSTTGTSASGSNFGTDNTQVNALETQFNGTTTGFTITARLKGPLSFMSAAYDGGGIYFGPDQDNYVKLIAEYDAVKGQTLQFADEQGATTHSVNAYSNIGSFASITTLDLKLTGDAGAQDHHRLLLDQRRCVGRHAAIGHALRHGSRGLLQFRQPRRHRREQ